MSEPQKEAAPETPIAASPATEAKAEAPLAAEANAQESVQEAAKPEEQKPPEAEKVVPEKYDLKLSENSQLDSSILERIAASAKAQGLSQQEAQELVMKQESEIAELVSARSNKWLEQVKADKELGGDALNKNVELAKRVVERFGSESLKSELNKSGFGNHPELVRLLSRIGKGMSEDQLVIPGAQASSGSRSMEDIFYGNKN